MRYEVHIPSDRLKPYVRHLVISEREDACAYPVLPDTAPVMGFQYAGQLAFLEDVHEHLLTSTGITGLHDGYRLFRNVRPTGTILAVFREAGAAAFIRQPVHELFGQSLSLEHFFSRQRLSDTEQRLSEAGSDRERLAIVDEFLLSHLIGIKEDLLVTGALQLIHRSAGTIRIKALADTLYTSQSPLEKRFRSRVGSSPKKFAGIVRLKHMLSELQNGRADFLEAYYDQAHFIHDFRRMTAQTPEQWLRSLRRGT
ncbi:MAG TPA: AraC family transcriptional regulator [Puia sp.]|nr:AraC family transcriptional regulator [Puia sp.]